MSNDTNDNKLKLVARLGERFGVDGAKVFETLKLTAFKQRNGSAPTNEQMMTLLIVADQYGLNPFTRELFAFPDGNGGIIPMVSVDGWTRIINNHPAMDGVEFVSSETMVRMEGAKVDCPEWIDCIIYRSDRTRPIKIREYLDEVYRPAFVPKGRTQGFEGPWQSHPKRFLRHKTLIQASRIAFGFSGIYDQDEGERIAEAKEMGNVVYAQNAQQPQPQQPQLKPQQVHKSALLVVPNDDPTLQKQLDTLIQRCINDNAWNTGANFFSTRYGDETAAYALQQLEIAKQEHELTLIANTPSAHTNDHFDNNQNEDMWFGEKNNDGQVLYPEQSDAFM